MGTRTGLAGLLGLALFGGPVGCARPVETVAVVPPLSPVPVWCYTTLARPDCYAEPQPPGTGRFVGAYAIERR